MIPNGERKKEGLKREGKGMHKFDEIILDRRSVERMEKLR